MPTVSSSVMQSVSFTETGGSGVAVSARTASSAPVLNIGTAVTGATLVYSTTFNVAASGTLDIDLYSTSTGGSDADDRGDLRFTKIHGFIVNLTSGALRVGAGPSDTQPANPWTGQPIQEGGSGHVLVGPASFAVFNTAQLSADISATNRLWRIAEPNGVDPAVGNIIVYGEGTVL